jgi:hypothetical protein
VFNNCDTLQKKDQGESTPFGPYHVCSTGKSSTPQRYDYIPVDFIKCEIINFNPLDLLNNFLLDFVRSINEETGETKIGCRYAIHQNIKVTLYDHGKAYLSGSLHKYFNEGAHNYNDFTHANYLETLQRLCTEFKIHPSQLRIQTLEYGVNITPPLNTDLILCHCLVHYRENIIDSVPSAKGKYKQAEHQKYIFKLYNKGRQYKQDREIMRIEVKQTNWSELRKLGIHTLWDFNQFDKTLFINNLIEHWKRIVFYDPTNPTNKKENEYSNVLYWERLKKGSKQNYSKHTRLLNELNSKGQDIQKQVGHLILKNIMSLQSERTKKLCTLTGIDITMQKENSHLLSHKGLYDLLENAPTEFERIKRIFLSRPWQKSPIEIQVKEIAHNIRNAYHNRTKREPQSQLTLFKTNIVDQIRLHI